MGTQRPVLGPHCSYLHIRRICLGFPVEKESTCQCRRHKRHGQSLSGERPLEKGMATHSSFLAWKVPWTEEPGGLQSMGSQTIGQDSVGRPLAQDLFLGARTCCLYVPSGLLWQGPYTSVQTAVQGRHATNPASGDKQRCLKLP